MDESEDLTAADVQAEPRARRSRGRKAAAVILLILALALGYVWATRETIAGNVIGAELRRRGLPATYKIVSIGPRREVLSDIVVGDPKHPDLTVARAVVEIVPRFGYPRIGRIALARPRLYGSLHDGKLSFGTLDKVLFTGGPKQPFRLPKLDLAIDDGRGLLLTDAGPVGLKLQGEGKLRGGFKGLIAINAPHLDGGDCGAERATAYGALSITDEKPHFVGPLRLAKLDCPERGMSARNANLALDATIDSHFDGGEGKATIDSGALVLPQARVATLSGTTSLSYRNRSLRARYDLRAAALESSAAYAGVATLEGALRSAGGFDQLEADGTLGGEHVLVGRGLDASLAGFQRSAADSFAGPLLAKLRGALAREGRASSLRAEYQLRRSGKVLNLVVPNATLRGGSGDTVLALSHFQLISGEAATPRLAGNFTTGGADLPRIAGRVERQPGGQTLLRMNMAEYSAGEASLAVPELVVAQIPGGMLGFAGQARLSGKLPGGSARDLVLPIDGNWSSQRGLSLWRRCSTLSFADLTYANLSLDRRSLTVCPGPGGAIVHSDSHGTRINLGAPSLDVSGRLGRTLIRIRSGPVGYANPGALFARQVDVALGPPATATQFRLANLTAQVGKEIVGRFAGTDAKLFAVPLDLLDASGAWRYGNGRLSIADGRFRLVDRRPEARFQPLDGRDGALTLFDNQITATAALHEPTTGRLVTNVKIRHNLATGTGHADLTVPGLTFDERLQPETISRLALGVVADTRGTIAGTGQIDWSAHGVTSTGRFSTSNLDFAAAFGPVRGASGTIVFTDLLGMVSAPNQLLHVASVNPGIEVTDGQIVYQLKPGSRLVLNSATWPFLGGTLRMRPVEFNFGVSETRRYVLEIEGLDAAKFVARMELSNISATGIFDGVLPLVFDTRGGRIEGGQLTSRAPGGNVSYVGALTYKNLSTIANFAFQALKSLDYRKMTIAMDGSLTGEIVTRVRFDQVRQGATAKRNFITQRFAKLPIQFNVNVRAPFYQLITSFKSLNDPAFTKDPRTVGLLDEQGRPIRQQVANPAPPAVKPPDIQPSDSEKKP